MLKGNATGNGCILFSDVLGENEHVVGIWNIFQKFGSVAWNGGVSLPQSRQRFAMLMNLWMCPLPCRGHPADPQLEDLHLERPSAALKGVMCGTLFLGANHLGIDESSPVECFFCFRLSDTGAWS